MSRYCVGLFRELSPHYVKLTFCFSRRLNREAKAFVTYISPTPVEHELRLWTIELIRRTIKRTWSDADVQCFGSVGTGLYLPGG